MRQRSSFREQFRRGNACSHPDCRATREKGAPAEYKAGLDLAIDRGWLWLHDSGTYVKFTQAGADLFA